MTGTQLCSRKRVKNEAAAPGGLGLRLTHDWLGASSHQLKLMQHETKQMFLLVSFLFYSPIFDFSLLRSSFRSRLNLRVKLQSHASVETLKLPVELTR